MRRRLQIARALINRPRLVLLDEPTTGLDPQARHAVWERLRLLRGARRDAGAHHPLHGRGRPALRPAGDHGPRAHRAPGRPADLVAAEVGREVLELRVAPGDVAAVLAPSTGPRATRSTATCWCCSPTTPRPSTRARVRAGVPIRLRAARAAGLEDVFLRVTGRRLRD